MRFIRLDHQRVEPLQIFRDVVIKRTDNTRALIFVLSRGNRIGIEFTIFAQAAKTKLIFRATTGLGALGLVVPHCVQVVEAGVNTLLGWAYGVGTDCAVTIVHGVAREHVGNQHRVAAFALVSPYPIQVVLTFIGARGGITVGKTDFAAFKIFAQYKVHHPRDRIGTIGGGGAAWQNFDTFDSGQRNGIDVDKRFLPLGKGTDRYPASIDQHQRCRGPQSPQGYTCSAHRGIA